MPEKMVWQLSCDIDGVEPARKFYIELGGKRCEVILCDAHAAPLEELMKAGKKVKAPAKPSKLDGQGLSRERVATLYADDDDDY